MKFYTIFATLFVAIFTASLAGQVIELPSTAESNSIWPVREIPVCWENPSANVSNEMRWVREAVEGSWQQHGDLSFNGWGTCPTAIARGQGIRIFLADVNPHVKALGRKLDGMRQGMVLNFTFAAWKGCGSREYCIRTIAVHEFGHAIGFSHEQNRDDSPKECRDLAQGSNGDWYVTPFDLDSVMNYCNPRYNGDGNLSTKDKQGLNILYPKFHNAQLDSRKWYTMASRNNRPSPDTLSCLHVLNHSPKDGNPIAQWHCQNTREFKFNFEPWPNMPMGYYRIRSDYGKCFRVSKDLSSLPVRRNSLVQGECTHSEPYKFLIERTDDDWYRIKSMDGMCYHVANGPTATLRMPLWSWECVNQPEFYLRLKAANF